MRCLTKKRAQGGVLVITLITGAIITMVLASYLLLISSRYNLTVRSLGWNAAIPVLESGIEEALAHLQQEPDSPGADGWTPATIAGEQVYTKKRYLADGSYFDVTLHNATSNNPTIYSSGFVPAPLRRGYISRTVKVTATKLKSFPAAISANGFVNLSGNAFVDSYNSCLGSYSTNNSHGTNGAIATNFQGNPAVKVGTAHVYGQVTTGPLGTVSVGGGAIGDNTWNQTSSGIQSGWSDDDMNVAFPANAPPPGGPFLPLAVISAGGSNITVLASDTYQLSSFSSTGAKEPMLVTGKATLYVTGNVSVSGNGYIKILPGASLTLIVGGAKTDIAGGGVANLTGSAANFTYIGLPTNTTLKYAGSAAFFGTINAPKADFSMSGNAEVFGAAIVNTYTSVGGSSFHYDECLGGTTSFILASWREL